MLLLFLLENEKASSQLETGFSLLSDRLKFA